MSRKYFLQKTIYPPYPPWTRLSIWHSPELPEKKGFNWGIAQIRLVCGCVYGWLTPICVSQLFFVYRLGLSAQGMVLITVSWSLLHQIIVKTITHRPIWSRQFLSYKSPGWREAELDSVFWIWRGHYIPEDIMTVLDIPNQQMIKPVSILTEELIVDGF